MKKIIFIIASILVVITLYTTLRSKKEITLGINTTFPPFEYLDEDGKEVIGFDVEIAKRIAANLDSKLKIEILGFYEIIPAIQDKKVDFGMSTFTITDERSEIVDFSIPYYENSQVFLVRNDDRSFDHLQTETAIGEVKRLGSRSDTTCLTTARNIAGTNEVAEFSTWPQAIDALLRERIDAIVVDNGTADAFVIEHQGIRELEMKFEDSQVFLIRNNDISFDHLQTETAIGEVKRLGSIINTTGLDAAKNIAGTNEVAEFRAWPQAIEALLRDRIDAVVVDHETAEGLVVKYQGLRELEMKFDTEYYGIPVHKGNKHLLNSINKTIQDLYDSGEHERLVKEWIHGYTSSQNE